MNHDRVGRTIFLLLLVFMISAVAKVKAADTVNRTGTTITQAIPGGLAQKCYDEAEMVFQNARVVHYEHLHRPAAQQVRCSEGQGCEARNDCSGFVSYVLHAVAPRHYREIHNLQKEKSYPQAKTYARFFSELGEEPERGWKRVNDVWDLKRGDIIAWEKGDAEHDHGGHGNSGHVMIVVDPPSPLCTETVDGGVIHYVSVYVVDSSSVRHFKPEVLPPLAGQIHRDGLGKGCIRIVLNDRSKPIGYWEGTYWGEGGRDINKPSFSRMIHFGRLVPFGEAAL